MKKLLVLVVAAALIGIVISRGHKSEPLAAQTADDVAAATAGPLAQAATPKATVDVPAPAPARPAATERAKLAQAASAVGPAAAAPSSAALSAPASAPVAKSDPASADALVQAQSMLKAGKRAEARALLTPLYLKATGKRAAQLRSLLDAINRELVFDPRCTEGAAIHVVAPGEVGVRIARKYGVNWGMIARINGMKPDGVLHVGQKLKVLEGKPSIIVHKGEYRLTLLWNGEFVKEYPIGIGRDDSPTPVGQFVVDERLVHPVWTRPDGVMVKYGQPGYALGERWMGFADEPGANGLGIHGTNEESSIGTKCSSGCVRMHNADVLELYDFVTVGTHVTIEE